MARINEINRKDVIYLREEGLTYSEICELVDVKASSIYSIITKKPAKRNYTNEKAQMIIDYIVKHGGSPKEVIKLLGIDIGKDTVSRVARKQGIKLRDYWYYLKENKNWICETPGRNPNKGLEIRVQGRCKHCGHIQDISGRSLEYQGGPKCDFCGGMGKPTRNAL